MVNNIADTVVLKHTAELQCLESYSCVSKVHRTHYLFEPIYPLPCLKYTTRRVWKKVAILTPLKIYMAWHEHEIRSPKTIKTHVIRHLYIYSCIHAFYLPVKKSCWWELLIFISES